MTDAEKMDRALELVRDVFAATAELEAMFPGRKFTPDGHLVGSLGEVIAAHRYGLTLNAPSTKAHDARAADGRKVEVKLTGSGRVSLRHEPATFDEAIVGWAERSPGLPVVVYSTERLVELLSRDMAHDEAVEHDERNLAVTWLVERTPLFVSLQHDR